MKAILVAILLLISWLGFILMEFIWIKNWTTFLLLLALSIIWWFICQAAARWYEIRRTRNSDIL
jgi:hypothetical protein